ncbi:MAG: phycobilisome linker polypeptide [Leptolyngbyaceae cyanobacterium MO_188.B28]|nr:phycobilisome linker polypeptide [Leptolyngbyaceae cyanobacterium MO_188.B28]
MLGKSSLLGASSASLENRVFVYEVEGLRQNDQTESNGYPIRKSSTTLVKIPHNRMNEEMRRITRLGGKIVKISSFSQYSSQHAQVQTVSKEPSET